ncbi:MAG: replication initiator protein A [Cyanobacteria bacterium SZAS LIN-5]|nr:replication initiator protein A [Cyanobacteria bacterium SZAS LIN-5]
MSRILKGVQPLQSNLETNDFELFESTNLVPVHHSENAHLPQLAWADVNALALPYAVLNEREARKSSGHELIKLENRDGKQIAIHWSVWPYPKLGMPTITTLRVLFVLMQKAAEAKQELGHVPERLEIGSLNSICTLVGLKTDGYSRKLLKKHVEILLSTQCKSKGAFKNKRGEGLFIDCFNFLRAAGFIGELDQNGVRIERNYIVFDEHVRANLDTRYVKQIDLQLMKSIASPIGQLLYTKLSNLFHEASAKKWAYVDVDYHWLVERMGLRSYQHVWEAKKQLKQAITELVDLHYIEDPVWNGFLIRFAPAVRYTFGEQEPRKLRKSHAKKSLKQLAIPLVADSPLPTDPMWPLCTLYANLGWKWAEPQAKRHGLTESQLRAMTAERQIPILDH